MIPVTPANTFRRAYLDARLVLRWASGEPGEAADGALPALRAALGEGEAKR